MKPDSKKKIMEAFRRALKRSGLPQVEEASEIRRAFAAGLATQESKLEVSLIVLRAWKKLGARLDEAPEPEDLEQDIQYVEGIPYVLRDQMLKQGKKLAHRPGGAPRKLTPEREKRVCRVVGNLMGGGDSHSQAVAKAAAQFNVSRKTIQRAWQKIHRKRKKP